MDGRWLFVGLAALAGVAGLLALLYVLRRVAARNAEVADDPAQTRESLACPRCGAPMAAGYTFTGRGILWRGQGERPVGAFSTIFEALENTLSMSLRPAENRAWRCAPSRLVLVDHATLVKRG